MRIKDLYQSVCNALSSLSGDLSYDKVADAKKILYEAKQQYAEDVIDEALKTPKGREELIKASNPYRSKSPGAICTTCGSPDIILGIGVTENIWRCDNCHAGGEIKHVDLSHEYDSRVWVREWLNTIAKHPYIPTDEGAMIGWFANSIMAGYNAGYDTASKNKETK